MNDLSCRFTQWWTRCSGGCEALESAAELKHKRLKSEVCICVCGRTLECGSPCLFHLLLGECWHLFAMCVMWMRIFVSIVWLAGGRGALLGVVKHNKCRGGGGRWHRGGTCMCVLGFRWDTFELDTLALSGVSTDNSLPTTGLACHRHHLSPLIHLALSVCCYLYQSLKIIYF